MNQYQNKQMKNSRSNEIAPEDMVFRNDPEELHPVVYSIMEDNNEIREIVDENASDEVREKPFELIVSSSLIKELMYRGTETDYCPSYIYNKYVLNQDMTIVSDAMAKGSYAETILLGGGARGKSTLDLPRLRNGNKSIDQMRIDSQMELAKILTVKKQMHIYPNLNTQILLFKKINDVLCRGELDIFPTTIINDEGKLCVAIVDLKLTADLNTLKNFQSDEALWGDYQNMDDTQSLMYLHLVRDIDWELNSHIDEDLKRMIMSIDEDEIRFFFWVFDYKKPMENLNNKLFEEVYTPMKKREIEERIRKVHSIFEYNNKTSSWGKRIPSTKSCKRCQDMECQFRNQIEKR